MKYFSLFSGIGGFEYGIDTRGTCVGFSEIDKYATSVFKRHYPEGTNYGDITTIDPTELPDFDLLVGGFPCQSFSIAGKRGGFLDTRGTLFFDIARILGDKRPRHLVLENVKGLLSHDNGKTFQTILAVLADLGYHIQWQVLNSKDFGVPQNRERVFIVGHLRGQPRPEVFPLGTTNGKTTQIYGRITGLKGHDYLRRIYSTNGASPTLPTGTGGNHQPKVITSLQKHATTNENRYMTTPPDQKINRTVRASGRESATDKHNWDLHQIGGRVRRLTPIECERLQGFPDNWTKYGEDGKQMSDTQRYKMCGNAVTTNVVAAIMTKLLEPK